MEPSLFASSGQTRTVFERDHALISPDGHVPASLSAWNGAKGVVLISPAMGARLAQTLVVLETGAASFQPLSGIEAIFYVLDGQMQCNSVKMQQGSFGFWPADAGKMELQVTAPARLVVFEKRYAPLLNISKPQPRFGHESDVEGVPFLGDPDARLQVLLPDTLEFDLAMNVFTYQPGATLPFVETHIMEHGLLMLDGMGIYRLNERWYPVAAGDCIWMAPYCPQWFAATGKVPARYVYYKDINRDATAEL